MTIDLLIWKETVVHCLFLANCLLKEEKQNECHFYCHVNFRIEHLKAGSVYRPCCLAPAENTVPCHLSQRETTLDLTCVVPALTGRQKAKSI